MTKFPIHKHHIPRIFFILLFSAFQSVFAQNTGDRDTTFITGTSTNSSVKTVGILPNGYILAGGNFSLYKGQPHAGVLLLQPNGTPDSTFTVNAIMGAGSDVRSSCIEQNGNILIGGFFSTINGTTQNKLARLQPNGQLDATFNTGVGVNNEVTAISSNGQKIAISGFFSQYNGTARSGFAVLENNGALDTGFTNPTWSGFIHDQYVLTNNKILVGGNFSSFHNAPTNRIARLHSDGSTDTSFHPGSGAGGPVETIAVQSDGKIILGGSFTSFNGVTHNRIVRLHPNGNIDTSFHAQLGFNSTVRDIAIDGNGKIVVAGQFTQFDGASANFIVRLNADGSRDQTFNTGSGLNGSTNSVVVQSDNKVVLGGNFTQFQGVTDKYILRLYGGASAPTPNVVFSQPQYTTPCTGDSVTLEIASGNLSAGSYWEWRLNNCSGAVIDTGWSLHFTPTAGTTDIFVAPVGLSNCASVQVLTTDSLSPVVDTVFQHISGYCEVTVNAQSSPSALDNCGGIIAGVPQGSLTYSTPGSYTLAWHFTDGSGNDLIFNQQIDVLEIDTALINVSPFVWETAHQSATAKYQWGECSGGQFNALPNDTTSSFIPMANGEYAVIITEGNCSDTSTCTTMAAWGIDEFGENHLLKIYPNPASEKINIEYPESFGDGNIFIYAMNGQMVWEEKVTADQPYEISIKSLPNGVYVIRVETKKYAFNQRIVKL